MAAIRPCLGCGEMSAMASGRILCAACEPKPEPTIPLTQVEAMLREAWMKGDTWDRTRPEARDEWIANKIKEARQ